MRSMGNVLLVRYSSSSGLNLSGHRYGFQRRKYTPTAVCLTRHGAAYTSECCPCCLLLT